LTRTRWADWLSASSTCCHMRWFLLFGSQFSVLSSQFSVLSSQFSVHGSRFSVHSCQLWLWG